MESCSICLEEIKCVHTSCKLSCSHVFHNKCISKWYRTSDNELCPFCRKLILEPYMFNIIKNRENNYFKFNTKRKTIDINGYSISFINDMLLNKNAIPFSWVEKNITINESNSKSRICKLILPTYLLSISEKEDYAISFYARLYIIYSNKDKIVLQKKKCLNNFIYFDTKEKISPIFSKREFMICFEWIYDVLTELKYRFDLSYLSITNTLLFDLFFKTVEHFKDIEQSQIQAILVCCIYNSIQILEQNKILPTLEDINFFTDGAYTLENIKSYFEKQNEILKELIKK